MIRQIEKMFDEFEQDQTKKTQENKENMMGLIENFEKQLNQIEAQYSQSENFVDLQNLNEPVLLNV